MDRGSNVLEETYLAQGGVCGEDKLCGGRGGGGGCGVEIRAGEYMRHQLFN